jgi:hypothetical protein
MVEMRGMEKAGSLVNAHMPSAWRGVERIDHRKHHIYLMKNSNIKIPQNYAP